MQILFRQNLGKFFHWPSINHLPGCHVFLLCSDISQHKLLFCYFCFIDVHTMGIIGDIPIYKCVTRLYRIYDQCSWWHLLVVTKTHRPLYEFLGKQNVLVSFFRALWLLNIFVRRCDLHLLLTFSDKNCKKRLSWKLSPAILTRKPSVSFLYWLSLSSAATLRKIFFEKSVLELGLSFLV